MKTVDDTIRSIVPPNYNVICCDDRHIVAIIHANCINDKIKRTLYKNDLYISSIQAAMNYNISDCFYNYLKERFVFYNIW